MIVVWALVLWTPMPARYLMLAILIGAKVLLGFRGNEWAWQSRQWESTQQFKLIQRMWMNWGTIIVVVVVILLIMFTRAPVTPDVPTS